MAGGVVSGQGKRRSAFDNVTLFTGVLLLLCFSWELANFATRSRVTYSEVFRRLNFQSGGLLFWGILAFLLHACIPFPASMHNEQAYIEAWGTSPDLQQNDM